MRSEVFKGSLVIGLNDAERIALTDITVFHANWVVQGLASAGYRSRLYVTSSNAALPDREVVRVPHFTLTQESSDLVMQRFLTDEFGTEDILFLTALKICRMVAQRRGRPQTVYMVGFDFDPAAGYAKAIGTDYAPNRSDEREVRIAAQEFYFINALYFLQNSDLLVRHVGNRAFSALSPGELNRAFLGALAETGRAPHAVAVVAELTTNHFGDRARLETMIRAAGAAGADYVKLQKRDVESFYSAERLAAPYRSPFGSTFGDYRRALELTRDDFAFVDGLCGQLGIGWFASVLDRPSFRFIRDFDPEIIKLPSTISEHTDYLSFVARNHRRGIVLSTGMTDAAHESWLLETFTGCSTLCLMQANSAYPTPLHDCHIGVVRHYDRLSRRDPRIVPGYSSHDIGWKASALAVAAGARMVEKHVKLGNTEWAHFDAVAVDLATTDFRDYVAAIREAELIVGCEEKRVNASEHHKYFRSSGSAP